MRFWSWGSRKRCKCEAGNESVVDGEVKPAIPSGMTDAYYAEVAASMRASAKRGGRPGIDHIMAATPVHPGWKLLDVGLGNGAASRYFLEKGLRVSATGLNVDQYGIDEELRKNISFNITDCRVEELPFEDNEFDACWMSHVLEHTMNPGIALQSVWRVLKPGGWLFVLVPPYKSQVVGGHLMTGWSLGQLMYVLLLNNFDVKTGHFVKLDYNVCAFVRKVDHSLPDLYSDIGDIEALSNYWPMPLEQGFEGDVDSINWPPKVEE
ncbi:MAG: class I SAM-dependent methyltransferase [Nitrospirae bacterium]|nr:class I SAM-dependent methyltransferase [Nitrospirota bacterium]